MNHKPMLVPLTLAQERWGLQARDLEAWAEEDGLTLRPSPSGASLTRRDLRAALTRRRLSLPAELIEWPKLLVADCRPEVLDSLRAALERNFPDAIVVVALPEVAPAELELHKPNALILDLESPLFDGPALCLRAAAMLPAARVVVLGGRREQLDAIEDLRADEALNLPPTPTPEELESALECLLRPRRAEMPRPKPLLTRLFSALT